VTNASFGERFGQETCRRQQSTVKSRPNLEKKKAAKMAAFEEF
jgi:hypothetical protein